ncbi:MAG: LamG-like jellyroll fold domain-containing protein [Candidatus Paceibacterota bacterium]
MEIGFENKKQKGFTLIEVMLAIFVVGILSSILILNNQSAVEKAIDTKVKTFANSLPIVLAGNYIANWKFDQINVPATNQTPSSWGEYPGTLTATGTCALPSLQTTGCVYDNCLFFDSTTTYDTTNYSYIYVPEDLTGGLRAITIEAWVNGQQASNIIRAANNAFILHFRGAGFYLNDRNNVNSGYLGWNTVLPYNTWLHLVATWDGTTMKLFINGVQQQSTLTYSGGHILRSGNPIRIGQTFNPSQLGFRGKMDNIRLFDDALSISQIQNEYLLGLNQLFAKNIIDADEYNERLSTLNQNLAQK